MFEILDIDNSGSLSLVELKLGLNQYSNSTDLIQKLQLADLDGSG
jgi:hypothetical protein